MALSIWFYTFFVNHASLQIAKTTNLETLIRRKTKRTAYSKNIIVNRGGAYFVEKFHTNNATSSPCYAFGCRANTFWWWRNGWMNKTLRGLSSTMPTYLFTWWNIFAMISQNSNSNFSSPTYILLRNSCWRLPLMFMRNGCKILTVKITVTYIFLKISINNTSLRIQKKI